MKKFLALSLFSALTAFAGDVQVNISNGTTAQPGFADRVSLVDLSMGMVEVVGESDVKGRTTLQSENIKPGGQYLLKAQVGPVSYSQMFVPDANLSAWSTDIVVYDVETSLRQVTASVPFFVIYAFQDRMFIQKRLSLDNQSQPPVSFYDAPGVVQVHLPDEAFDIQEFTFKSGSMPLKTQAIPVDGGKVIPNALKPGVAEIDMGYYLEYDPAGTDLSEYIPYDVGHFHVYTMPTTLKISAPGLTSEGLDRENGLASGCRRYTVTTSCSWRPGSWFLINLP